jgi:hypothetical protein
MVEQAVLSPPGLRSEINGLTQSPEALDTGSAEPRLQHESGIPLETAEAREAAFEELKELLHDFAHCLDGEPTTWKACLQEAARGYQAALADESGTTSFSPIVREFLADYVDVMCEQFDRLVSNEAMVNIETDEERDKTISLLTIDAIKRISHHIELSMNLTQQPVVVQEIAVEDVVRLFNEKQKNDGTDRFALELTDESLRVYSAQQDKWFDFPVPQTEDVYHKGGFPRVLLKLHAGAPPETIEAELPPNDFDIVALQDSEAAYEESKRLDIEAEGIESVKEFDFKTLCATRDVNLNSCFVGAEKLVFTTEAFQAAQTGVISLMASERGLFGSEFFLSNGTILARNRGISRLMKFVAEGKAEGFWFNARNQQVEMGIYWNVLARKFGEKDGAPELCANLFDLGVQGGQIDPDQLGSFYEVVDATHEKYPFFDFHQGPQDEIGVARWILGTKFCRQIENHFREQVRLHRESSLVITEGDDVPFVIRLSKDTERFIAPNEETHKLQWAALMDRCRERTAVHQQENSPESLLSREIQQSRENGEYAQKLSA